MLALHDPSSSTVTLVPAPTYLMSHTVKRLKTLSTAPAVPAQTSNMEARNKLGEAFGTRKAKSAIKTAERNKVDVEGMEGVRELMQEGIESGGAVLPTKGASWPRPRCAEARRCLDPPLTRSTDTPRPLRRRRRRQRRSRR